MEDLGQTRARTDWNMKLIWKVERFNPGKSTSFPSPSSLPPALPPALSPAISVSLHSCLSAFLSLCLVVSLSLSLSPSSSFSLPLSLSPLLSLSSRYLSLFTLSRSLSLCFSLPIPLFIFLSLLSSIHPFPPSLSLPPTYTLTPYPLSLSSERRDKARDEQTEGKDSRTDGLRKEGRDKWDRGTERGT